MRLHLYGGLSLEVEKSQLEPQSSPNVYTYNFGGMTTVHVWFEPTYHGDNAQEIPRDVAQALNGTFTA